MTKRIIKVEQVVEVGQECSFSLHYDGDNKVSLTNLNAYPLVGKVDLDATPELTAGCMAKLKIDLPSHGSEIPALPKGTMGMIIRVVHSVIDGPLERFDVEEHSYVSPRKISVAHFKVGTYPIIPIGLNGLEPMQ